MPNLTLKYNDKSFGDYQLQKSLSLTIGRRKSNDVVIENLSVSGHHAKIDSVGDGFVLIDLQSKNGSFVNEQLINSHWLKHGDVINIGEHSLVFYYTKDEQMPDDDSAELEKTTLMDTNRHRSMMVRSNPTKSINVVRFWDKSRNPGMMEESIPKAPRPLTLSRKNETVGVLKYLAGGSGKVELIRKITTIGKHTTSDVVVKGFMVGRTAATINKRPDNFLLSYVGGLSIPKLNKEPVKQPIILNDLDIIDIGSTKLQFSIQSG